MNRRAILLMSATAVLALLAALAIRMNGADGRGTVIELPAAPSNAATSDAGPQSALALSAPEESAPTATSTDARRADERPKSNARDESAARLDRAVAFLRTLLPDRFGALTSEEARTLTTLDLGGAHLRDGDLAQLAALPALDSVSLR